MALGQWGVGTVVGNRYGIQGQNYVPVLLGSEISAWFHYRNLIFDMWCFILMRRLEIKSKFIFSPPGKRSLMVGFKLWFVNHSITNVCSNTLVV